MSKENFEIRISKEELAQLPTEKFVGDIVVVDDEGKIDEVVTDLERSLLVGFDTETKPAFQKGQINRVALLQLSTDKRSYLIRLSKIGFPDKIRKYLEDSSKLKVGLSIKDDFHNLSKYGEFNPGGFIDLQDYVKEFRICDFSLTKIHGIVFGTRISKNQQLTNWESPNLTPKQKEYAALDALACINIYRQLSSGNFIPEKSQYCKCPKEE